MCGLRVCVCLFVYVFLCSSPTPMSASSLNMCTVHLTGQQAYMDIVGACPQKSAKASFYIIHPDNKTKVGTNMDIYYKMFTGGVT